MHRMYRVTTILLALTALVVGGTQTSVASENGQPSKKPKPTRNKAKLASKGEKPKFIKQNRPLKEPKTIELPKGFRPEGIISVFRNLFVGSISTGDIYRTRRSETEGSIFIDAPEGRSAIGLELDSRRQYLWVAGGSGGDVTVYKMPQGNEIAHLSLPLPSAKGFINDIHVGHREAYITDSLNNVFYRVDLDCGPRGNLECSFTPKAVKLTGEWKQVKGYNANGIVGTPGNDALLIINSATGILYKVNPKSGEAKAVSVRGKPKARGKPGKLLTFPSGDGLLRRGNTLWIVQNRKNRIAELELDFEKNTAKLVKFMTDSKFDVPTTLTISGRKLYTVNARFGTERPDQASYQIVRVNE